MIELYKSNRNIWWNKGNEIKPTKEDFLNLQWTKLPNFNINWVDEMTISLVCGLQDTFDLIKIVNEDGETQYDKIRYYYLKEIRNKTKNNKECLFELDLWTTYVLEDTNKCFSLDAWSTTKEFNDYIQEIPQNVELPQIGIMSNVKTIKAIEANSYGIDIIINPKIEGVETIPAIATQYNGTATSITTATGNIYNIEPYKRYTEQESNLNQTLYFVFQAGDKDNQVNEYWLVPEFRDDIYYKTDKLLNGFYDSTNKYYKIDAVNYYKKTNNSRLIINQAIEKPYDYGFRRFVGAFFGPHFLQIKKEFIEYQVASTTRDIEFQGQEGYWVANNVPSGGVLSTSGYLIPSRFLYLDATSSNEFLKIKITDKGVDLLKIADVVDANILKELMTSNYTFLNNENLPVLFTSNKLYFTNKFVMSNSSEYVELMTEVPTYVDEYYQTLLSQKNTIDTGYQVQKNNLITNMVSSGVNTIGSLLAFPLNPLTAATAVSQALPIAKGVVQLSNIKSKYEAFYKDLRNSTGTTTSTSSSLMLSTLTMYLDNTTIRKGIGYLIGYKMSDNEWWYNLFGFNTNPYKLGYELNDIQLVNKYIQIPESYEMKFKLQIANILSPNVRDMLWEMLKNGILVVSLDKLQQEIGGLNAI